MSKYKYTTEYELRASNKMLFSYLTTPAGLAQWFADEVHYDANRNFVFIWDKRPRVAKLVAQRLNRYVKFEFLPEAEEDKTNPSYLEFKLDLNELTQSSFLKIIDYSEMDNEEDLKELWAHLVSNLREIVGG